MRNFLETSSIQEVVDAQARKEIKNFLDQPSLQEVIDAEARKDRETHLIEAQQKISDQLMAVNKQVAEAKAAIES